MGIYNIAENFMFISASVSNALQIFIIVKRRTTAIPTDREERCAYNPIPTVTP